MIFSIVSIIFGVLTIIVRLFNDCIDCTRGDNLNSIYIEFMIKSLNTDIIKEYHIHTHDKLASAIHFALGVVLLQFILYLPINIITYYWFIYIIYINMKMCNSIYVG